MSAPRNSIPWQPIAVASGACASFNGVFAKLTTAETTSSWAIWISQTLGLSEHQQLIEYGIRLVVFILFFSFSGLMWGLYTRALSLSPSTIQVNIINTTANFVITALLGMAVFGERLPTQWWIGVGLLVTGSVIIGRREEQDVKIKEDNKKKQ